MLELFGASSLFSQTPITEIWRLKLYVSVTDCEDWEDTISLYETESFLVKDLVTVTCGAALWVTTEYEGDTDRFLNPK